ncbi:MAG: hypothetical protein GY805_12605 [Chloroflexi bacterium]|nr:hypothetical protein [Chloroflexota bacterium]
MLFFPLKALRERITYPRVGYVEFFVPENFGRKKLGFLMVMTASLVLLAYVANGRFPIMPIGFTILFGLILYFAASVKNGIRLRDWVVIGLALAIGGLATYLFENWRMGTAVQMWLMAVLFILIGTVDLIQFMHKYPVREVHNDATN